MGHVSGAHTRIPQQHLKPVTARMFQSARRPMPPPVSNEDLVKCRRPTSVDELGIMHVHADADAAETPLMREERTNTVRNMRRVIKAIVTGKTAAKAKAC